LAKTLPIVPSAKPGSMAEAPSGIVWREQHPEVDQQCNLCLRCLLYCPEGALTEGSPKVTVALNLCNGCGTCAVECPQNAIKMVPEFTGDRGIFPMKEGKL
jgi:2-oxoacid:acceptor oxidoreductase delta subunit (pyruvate/2-ketoisovalerate family)